MVMRIVGDESPNECTNKVPRDGEHGEPRNAAGAHAMLAYALSFVSMAIWWLEGNLGFKIVRAITLLMIPFCWIVFYDQSLVPREGHILWVAGMVVALFSDSLSSSREVPVESSV